MSMQWEKYWSLEGDKLYFTQDPEKKATMNRHEVHLTDQAGAPLTGEAVKKTFDALQEDASLTAAKYWNQGHLVVHITADEKQKHKILLEPLEGQTIGVKAHVEKSRIHPKFKAGDVAKLPPLRAEKGPILAERSSHILAQKDRDYVIRLRLENRAPPGTYLDRDEHGLRYSVFVGDEGQLIAIYDKTVLGQGNFGQVVLGMDVVTGRGYAVKIPLSAEGSMSPNEEKALRAMGVFVDKQVTPDQTVGVQELAWGVDLGVLLQDQTVPDSKRVHILNLVMKKLDELHRLNFLHRDIKPENIMYDEVEDVVRVIDFGFAEEMKGGLLRSDEFLGTPQTIAKELWQQSSTGDHVTYSPKTDVYAAGLLAAILLHRPSQLEIINHVIAQIKAKYDVSVEEEEDVRAVLASVVPQDIENPEKQAQLLALLSDTASDANNALGNDVLVDFLINAIKASPYQLFNDALQRRFGKVADYLQLSALVRESLPDVFEKMATTDPLRQVLTGTIAMMGADDPTQRPCFKEVAAIMDVIDKQYALLEAKKELSPDFGAQILSIKENFRKVRELYKKGSLTTFENRPNQKYIEFATSQECGDFMAYLKRAGYTRALKTELGKADFRKARYDRTVEVSDSLLTTLKTL